MIRLGKCRACGLPVGVEFSDGEVVRSDEVHTMHPIGDGPILVLHAVCEKGDEVSPVIDVEGWTSVQRVLTAEDIARASPKEGAYRDLMRPD